VRHWRSAKLRHPGLQRPTKGFTVSNFSNAIFLGYTP